MKKLAKLSSLAFASCIIAFLLTVSGCKKPDEKTHETATPQDTFGLSEAQLKNVLAISEAFVESGQVYPLPISAIEPFVYYLYNGELTAGTDGYAVIPFKEASERLNMYFGITSILHTQKNNTDQNFYFSDDKYYVKTNACAATSCDVVSVKQNDDGNYAVSVKVIGEGDTRVDLAFVFNINGDSTRIVSCNRYDEK